MIERLEAIAAPGAAGPLRLQRAWPRGDGHLVLEYHDADGRIVPGQWLRDAERRARIARQTARRACDPADVVVTAEGVVLQPGGADRRLPGLAALMRGSTLVAHRPERRAVLRSDGETGRRFFKIVRPDHVADLLATSRYLATQPDRPFDVPEIVGCDEANGVVCFASLHGRSMFDLLDEPRQLVPAAAATGAALRWLHAQTPPGARRHDAAREATLLSDRLERLCTYRRPVHRLLDKPATRVIAELGADASADRTTALVHRDLYDKQVFAREDGSIGLLDFDTLAVGEPGLDVANMLVHLELRVVQGRLDAGLAERCGTAFLDGYGPSQDVDSRLAAWSDATRLRLACLYAYRPRWQRVPEAMASRLATGSRPSCR